MQNGRHMLEHPSCRLAVPLLDGGIAAMTSMKTMTEHLACDGLEKGRGPDDAVGDVACLLRSTHAVVSADLAGSLESSTKLGRRVASPQVRAMRIIRRQYITVTAIAPHVLRTDPNKPAT